MDDATRYRVAMWVWVASFMTALASTFMGWWSVVLSGACMAYNAVRSYSSHRGFTAPTPSGRPTDGDD